MTVAMAITLMFSIEIQTKSDLELILKNLLIISVRHMVTFLCNTAQHSPAQQPPSSSSHSSMGSGLVRPGHMRPARQMVVIFSPLRSLEIAGDRDDF